MEEETILTNVVGVTKLYDLSFNFFRNQGFGHLVGITSIASIRGNRSAPAYFSSKAYQKAYLESLFMKTKTIRSSKVFITEPANFLFMGNWKRILCIVPGPYAFWHHKHFIHEIDGGVEMEDFIDYKVPFGILGRIIHPLLVKPKLEKIFSYRQQKLEKIFGKYINNG